MSLPIRQSVHTHDIQAGIEQLRKLTGIDLEKHIQSLVNKQKVKLECGSTIVTITAINPTFKNDVLLISKTLYQLKNETAKKVQEQLIIGQLVEQIKNSDVVYAVKTDLDQKTHYTPKAEHAKQLPEEKKRNIIILDEESKSAIAQKADDVFLEIQSKISELLEEPHSEIEEKQQHTHTPHEKHTKTVQEARDQPKVEEKATTTSAQEALFTGWKKAMDRQKDDDAITNYDQKKEAQKKADLKRDDITRAEITRQEKRRKTVEG